MSDDWTEPESAGEEESSQASPEDGEQVGQPAAAEDDAAADIGTRALSEAARVAFVIMLGAMAALVGVYLYQRLFWVQLNEVNIKLRFGRPVKVDGSYIMDPGSGYHFLWPGEEVVPVPTNELPLEINTEFMPLRRARTEREERLMAEQGISPRERPVDVKRDGFLITGDANIVHLRMKVRYAVGGEDTDLLDYAFGFRGPDPEPGEEREDTPEGLLERFAVQSAIETVGSWTIEDVRQKYRKTPGGATIHLQQEIHGRITAELDAYRRANGRSLGIRIEGVELTAPRVPPIVQPAFDAARDAQAQMAQRIHEADNEEQQILARARRRAGRIIRVAEGYATQLVNTAKADAEMLQTLSEAYGESPEAARILRSTHYHRMIAELFAASEDTHVFFAEPEGANHALQIQFSPVAQTIKSRLMEAQQQLEAQGQQGAAGAGEHAH